MKKGYFIIALLTTLSLSPCLAQKHQHGKASFYSKRATGARSASGQKIHHDSLVCAHRFFPFGTKLKVTNMSNGKSVVVKVIDRGPFGRGRIIDISWAAAKAIGMIAQGVASVKVERLDNPVPYRPEDDKLPRIDFEMAESDFKDYPKWKKERDTKHAKSSNEQNVKESSKGHKEATNGHKEATNGHKEEGHYKDKKEDNHAHKGTHHEKEAHSKNKIELSDNNKAKVHH